MASPSWGLQQQGLEAAHAQALISTLESRLGVPKSLQCSSFKTGTVLYQSTWLLHCCEVLIYRSCSMKYLAETKHMHPLSSG